MHAKLRGSVLYYVLLYRAYRGRSVRRAVMGLKDTDMGMHAYARYALTMSGGEMLYLSIGPSSWPGHVLSIALRNA